MKFDYVIGNPPYQQESNGANANDAPIYHYFYDAAFKVSDKAELISVHPTFRVIRQSWRA